MASLKQQREQQGEQSGNGIVSTLVGTVNKALGRGNSAEEIAPEEVELKLFTSPASFTMQGQEYTPEQLQAAKDCEEPEDTTECETCKARTRFAQCSGKAALVPAPPPAREVVGVVTTVIYSDGTEEAFSSASLMAAKAPPEVPLPPRGGKTQQ